MKIFGLLLLLLVPAALHAQGIDGDIYSIDQKAGTIAISSKAKILTYRVRPNTEITINGARGKFEELNTGMTARVVSAEPSVASKIVATGTPAPTDTPAPAGTAAGKPPGDLKALLSDSRWELKDGKRFTLHADGTTTGSWHERKGFWKIAGPNTVEMHVNWAPAPAVTVSVNPEATILRWQKDGNTAKRVKE